MTETISLYIAGPMRGYAEFNAPAFDAAAAELRAAGFAAFNPAEHDRSRGLVLAGTSGEHAELGAAFDLRETLREDLSWIADNADGLAVLPGWQQSKGANAEVALARALDLPVVPAADWARLGVDRALAILARAAEVCSA